MKNLAVITLKPETTYGVDSGPTHSANVIVCQNFEMNPLEMETDDYNPIMPNFGQGEKIVGATWCSVSFDVLLCGGGAPLGTVPNWGPIARSCAVAQTVSAGVNVAYSLISTGEESSTMWAYHDGILQKIRGMRGNLSFNWTAMKAPVASFRGMGLNVPMTDASMPVPTLPSIPRPLAVNKANTVLTIDGYAARLSQFTIDLGRDVQYRNRTGREDVVVAGGQLSGKVTIEMPLVAEKDFLGATGFCTLGTAAPMSIVHGSTLGNVLTQSLGKVQLLKPKPKYEKGTLMLDCDLHIARVSGGNDEWTMVCT
jgi:hypothetical protein